ncbi:hypothetical protein [Citrobacter braakii]|uniref:hypothetical protein n=1 Tax=Citrobacter braakii TaxID=57706 RepID=UPI00054367B6|nr:hypothetical protein [Citrobacter braakii]KHE08183.1 hypothetical protein IB70_06030 [Citrobacter braakii]
MIARLSLGIIKCPALFFLPASGAPMFLPEIKRQGIFSSPAEKNGEMRDKAELGQNMLGEALIDSFK